MMISPEMYVAQFKDEEYLTLMKERDSLLARIRDFEKKEMAGDRSGAGWEIMPSPDTIYQMNLMCLGLLCQLMHEKYREEYALGDRTLSEDKKKKNKSRK